MPRVLRSVVFGLALLLCAACAGHQDPGLQPDPATTSSTSAAPDSTSPSPSPSPSADDEQTTEVAVSVKDGEVVPPTHRVQVDEGNRVRLMVTSDVDDEVHVHGYDIEKELTAGQTTTVTFTADQSGLFEVETHDGGLQLMQLAVR